MQQQYNQPAGSGGGNPRADMWLMSHTSYFKPEHMVYLQEHLRAMPPERIDMLMGVKLHNPTTILLFSIFLGELGVDRFILGDTGLGVGKLLTLGGCLVWWLIDLFLISDRARVKNFENITTALGIRPYAIS